jgi:hypothetical protein
LGVVLSLGGFGFCLILEGFGVGCLCRERSRNEFWSSEAGAFLLKKKNKIIIYAR